MKITISGTPGSGKSTVAKIISKKLGYKYYSLGNIRRHMAEARGLTIIEYNNLKEDTDTEVDIFQTNLGKGEDNFILESRLGYHFIPDSFKIHFSCRTDIAAKRIYGDPRKSEKPYSSLKDAEAAIIERAEGDSKRYMKIYNIKYPDMEAFDLVIDTSDITIEEVVEKVMSSLKKYLPH